MKYKYWLSNIYGLWNGKKIIFRKNDISAEELYYMEENSIRKINGLTEKDIEIILKSRIEWEIDEKWGQFSMSGYSFISVEDKVYPERLRKIIDPPYSLYYKGSLPDNRKASVAIVGARGRSAYGESVAKDIGRRLAKSGINVISGMARGIDRDSHMGAIDGDGSTYAVLGCGVNKCYPRENKFLYDLLPEKGGIISEYPLNTEPLPIYFPQRNRIISGLSDVVVVVEARLKSGSLITADYALEQGKDVYVVPGRVCDSLSQGCNALIKQGANILNDLEEFVKEVTDSNSNEYVQMDFRKNLLEKEESLVYSLLDFRPIGIGTLMEKLPYQLSELLTILESLEGKGFIRETIPNYFVREL